MIRHPFAIVVFLVAVEAAVLYFSSRDHFKKYFQFLPFIFWIYFLPMLASTAGLIDSKAEIVGGVIIYNAEEKTNNNKIKITITNEKCSDGMSERKYNYK